MTRGNGTRRIPPLFLFMTLLTCAAAEPVAESLAPDTITTNTLAMLPAQKASALDLPQAVTTDSAIPVAASITGADLLRQYARLDKVAVVDGVYYQDIHKGTGNSPKRGQIVYFMIKAYAADGGELAIGDTNHSHPEGASPVHTHANPGYRSRWIFFGDGGGSFSLGTREMDQLFSQTIAGMQEMGTRLVYIPSRKAYGSQGYEGHEFKVLANTDLVFRISLVRVVDLVREEELGLR
jgi:hypothetical protein